MAQTSIAPDSVAYPVAPRRPPSSRGRRRRRRERGLPWIGKERGSEAPDRPAEVWPGIAGEGVADDEVTGRQHARILTGAPGRLHALHQVRHAGAVGEFPTGLAAVGDLQRHVFAHAPAVAETNVGLVRPVTARFSPNAPGRSRRGWGPRSARQRALRLPAETELCPDWNGRDAEPLTRRSRRVGRARCSPCGHAGACSAPVAPGCRTRRGTCCTPTRAGCSGRSGNGIG